MSPTRLTRAEQQQRTRRELVRAGAVVFARHGLQGATAELVAAEAGFTKGAFYAHFPSKQALFLELLEDYVDERGRAIDHAAGISDPVAAVREGGTDASDAWLSDEAWVRLFFDFALHAARAEDFGRETLDRFLALEDRIREAVERRPDAHRLGSTARFAQLVFCAGHGVAFQQLLDPDGTPEDLLAELLELLTLGALSRAGS